MRPVEITKCSEESENKEAVNEYEDLINTAKTRIKIILMANGIQKSPHALIGTNKGMSFTEKGEKRKFLDCFL